MENKLVGVLVAIFAFIFVAAYVLVFGSNPTSTDPEDWAYFATYLSGTVGVTAVLGTLYAVVRTLGQQQALIDSQKDMLEKQEQQLELTKIQLRSEKERREIEMAYDNVKNVLPVMINFLSSSVRQYKVPNDLILKMIHDNLVDRTGLNGRDLFKFPGRLMAPVVFSNSENIAQIESYVEKLMEPCLVIYETLFRNLIVTPELYGVVSCYLNKRFEGPYHDAYFYMTCVMAYKAGSKDLEFCSKAISLLNMKADFEGSKAPYVHWYEFGQRLSDAKKLA